MQIGFIDPAKYNLDMFLLDPDAYYSEQTHNDKMYMYRGIFNSMIDSNHIISGLHNIKFSISSNKITFTISTSEVKRMSAKTKSVIFNSKWCIISENNIYDSATNTVIPEAPDNMWYVCKIDKYERTDVDSFRFTCTIDRCRTYPLNTRVYKLFDNYNGVSNDSNDNLPLSIVAKFEQYFTITENDWVAVGIFIGDTDIRNGAPRNSTYIGRVGYKETDSSTTITYKTLFGNQLYTASYLRVFLDQSYVTITTNTEFDTILNRTTLTDSVLSLNRFLKYYRDNYGTSEDSIVNNLIRVYLVPKWLIKRKLCYADFTDGDVSTGIRIEVNSQTITLAANCVLEEDTILSNISIDTNMRAIARDYYDRNYPDLFTGKSYIKCIIDTIDSKIELNYDDFNIYQSPLHFMPIFNGTIMNYKIAFNNNDSVISMGKSFPIVPTVTIASQAFLNSENKVNTIKMLNTALSSVGQLAAGSAMSHISARGAARMPEVITTSVTNTVNSLADFNYKIKQGTTQSADLSTSSENIIGINCGLINISYIVSEHSSKVLMLNETNFFGIYADSISTDPVEINFNRENNNDMTTKWGVKYHKGNGIFSTPELLEEFSNGIFIVNIDYSHANILTVLNIIELMQKNGTNKLGFIPI